jgi:hypothetical protein
MLCLASPYPLLVLFKPGWLLSQPLVDKVRSIGFDPYLFVLTLYQRTEYGKKCLSFQGP